MTDHAPMKLDKHYTCWLEKRWHISDKSPIARQATGLLFPMPEFNLRYSKILTMVQEAVM